MIKNGSSLNTELEMFCVLYVDMESSTHNIAHLCPEGYTMYYKVFYDTLSNVAHKFGGRVIKHVGDALIIYFPATSDSTDREAFKSAIDCGISMLEARCTINNVFHEEDLPSISYRISADYGQMTPIETETSPIVDWIGPSMNMVTKMNHLAHSNNMVIGGDLHQILSRFPFNEYLLKLVGELNIGIRQKYPIYSVTQTNCLGEISSGIRMDDVGSHALIHLARNGTGGGGATSDPTATVMIPNIVIVDDEDDILLTYKRFLSDQPVNVELFSDPVQLLGRLALVGPSYYDLAIIDIKMPKINGFQVFQILTALKPGIKALFISALDHVDEVLGGLRGIDREEDFIRKPISREVLVSAISKKIRQSVLV